ncbi:PAS domain-containing protein [Paracraurococcus lichenis]|uniref:PAS domain-containing protein n=1 Tax=Paracraurococcus lichenis TaxID=3064888 RepID=A0ABT9E2A3_9PROT|nr:PAS domain-containing protein [Paracraurococcus sp. LOR1-02]MDO9710160.1 PAS domain-containing protein [Paracraurococcus sp. LOR1-02]
MPHNRLLKSISGSFDSLSHAITIASATMPGMPLVYVNPGFEKFTGYSRHEVLGQNCRFLQGKRQNQTGMLAIRDAIAGQKSCIVDLDNFRKDGSYFRNRLSLRPVFDHTGLLIYYIGLQNDITSAQEIEDNIFAILTARDVGPTDRPAG